MFDCSSFVCRSIGSNIDEQDNQLQNADRFHERGPLTPFCPKRKERQVRREREEQVDNLEARDEWRKRAGHEGDATDVTTR